MNNDLKCFLSLTEHELHVLETALHYFASDFHEFDKDWRKLYGSRKTDVALRHLRKKLHKAKPKFKLL